jgi:hypothetical protein
VKSLFRAAKPVIGMLHAPALPGSPGNSIGWPAIRERVAQDAKALAAGGVDGLILENFGDAPFYPNRVPPHTVAFLTALGREVRARCALPLGINVLRNDARSALAVAAAVEAQFIRVNILTGARVTDQGVIEGEAHELLRYRKLLAADVLVFADVAVKHSAPLGVRDLSEEIADLIQRGGADAIIVSGAATGKETPLERVRAAKQAAGTTPVLVGSGVRPENAARMLRYADGVIAGTALERDGVPGHPVDPARVRKLMQAARRIV